ncbi:MAG: serine/threonine-protein kinase PknD [Chlamydiales bacterium]
MPQSEIHCVHCGAHFFVSQDESITTPAFCSFCGQIWREPLSPHTNPKTSQTSLSEASIIKGQAPLEESVKFSVGSYQILDTIGKGGMGEVFLAYDPSCGRRIALKRIRTDLTDKEILYERFLKEARITSQLTHPSIIPIYSIHEEGDLIYYTMPYVEGETLKQVLRKTRQQEKRGDPLDHLGGSIPSLVRILIAICNAVAYAHSHHVIHRDLKPENIIVGRFGEVMILDWGLAKILESPTIPTEPTIPEKGSFTSIGKVVGTVTYMAPERALGQPANQLTDVYALGVILYQMLTLHQPFQRGSLKEFRKNMHKEKFIDPTEVAPYRDVSKMLVQICKKSLHPNPERRYQNVNTLIRDLENYIEGRSEWFRIAGLDIHNKKDWEFQENVLIAEHIVVTRGTDASDWVSLMISKGSFSQNIRVETKVKIGSKGHGIGFLVCIPEAAERRHLNDGYCLWLGTDNHLSTKLLRSTVEVAAYPEVTLKRGEWVSIAIEKLDNNVYLFLDGILQFSYIGYSPLMGTHVGLLARDADFEIGLIDVFVGGQTATVSCLAIPDAFLAHKDYDKALTEYRRIGYAFKGRAEGREAQFRAGITLLEKAKITRKESDYDDALEEFALLHYTAGAPLEYLGKALVYQAQNEDEEEIKCFTLAFRRYPRHPLLPVIHEKVIARMHEAARTNRIATYHLIYLVVRHIPQAVHEITPRRLFKNLKANWESLWFMIPPESALEEELNTQFLLTLAFWLAKPHYLLEILHELIQHSDSSTTIFNNALFALLELGSWESTKHLSLTSFASKSFRIALSVYETPLNLAIENAYKEIETLDFKEAKRLLFFLFNFALERKEFTYIHQLKANLPKDQLDANMKVYLDGFILWSLLYEQRTEEAGRLLNRYTIEEMSQEHSIFNFLYGCWLAMTEGEELARIHFSALLDVPFPRSYNLAPRYIMGKIIEGDRWFSNAFLWEKRKLYQQLELYFHCVGDPERSQNYRDLAKKESIHV